MADELTISDKTYVSSKRASEMSGYTQDYIGQLSRGGLIDAQRVGGLWYINADSLMSYKQTAEQFKPQPPKYEPQTQDPDSLISFDGKDYVSAARGAKLTGYNQDYIGQLARGGKILSRQVGNRWYVDREGLLAHKAEKDALLAAVQTESVGVHVLQNAVKAPEQGFVRDEAEPQLTYITENRDLLPMIAEKNREGDDFSDAHEQEEEENVIPIRIAEERPRISPIQPHMAASLASQKAAGARISAPAVAGALTVIIVLSYGILSFKKGSVYTLSDAKTTVETASAAQALQGLGDILEKLLTRELIYRRQ